MEVSVIVPTYNRASHLEFLFGALEKQTFQDFEVVLVNDGSTDNTLASLRRLSGRSKLNCNIIHSQNKGRAASRNLGAKRALGDLLIFYDDDVRPNPNSVKAHYAFHQKYNEHCLLSGPCLYDDSKFRHDFNKFRALMESRWHNKNAIAEESKTLRVNGGNFSIKRKTFDQAKGFDERLKDKEDFKLAYDANRQCGAKVFCNYATWAFHDDYKDLLQYIIRARQSREEEFKLLNLEPAIKSNFPERAINSHPNWIKNALFGLFRNDYLIRLCNAPLFSAVVSESMRHKIYDLLITANVNYQVSLRKRPSLRYACLAGRQACPKNARLLQYTALFCAALRCAEALQCAGTLVCRSTSCVGISLALHVGLNTLCVGLQALPG